MLGAADEESLCTSGVSHTSTQMQSQTILSRKGPQGSSSPTLKCMASARLKHTTHPGIISMVLGLSDSCTARLASASQAGCTGDFMDTALSCPQPSLPLLLEQPGHCRAGATDPLPQCSTHRIWMQKKAMPVSLRMS